MRDRPREVNVAQTPTLQLIFEVSTPDRPSYRVTLRKTQNIIGRESGDIVLNDVEASALHAEIDSTTGHVIVRDLGSSNGTWHDGKRQSQFALYEGQSFYCGNTELRLAAIEGQHEALQPGQTAVGRTKVKAHKADTLVGTSGATPVEPPPGWSPPSPVSLGTPAPVTEATSPLPGSNATLPGPHAPSSSPTAPATSSPTIPTPPEAPSSVTLPGPAGTPSSATVPGPAGITSATPSSRTVPVDDPPAPPKSETPPPEVVDAAAAETVAESVVPVPPTAPDDAVTRAEPEVFRAPVANAVIKAGGAGAEEAKPEPMRVQRQRRGWGRLFMIAGVSALGVSALVGLGYLLYTLLAGRALAFGETVAEELPESTIGFVALRSVQDATALLAAESEDDADDPWKELRLDAMGFDPYDVDAWSKQGVDPAAPVGFAVLDTEPPTFAVSLGVSDAEGLTATLKEQVPRLLAADPEASAWIERSFGEADGLWHESRGIAVVDRGERRLVVFAERPGWNDDVLEHAKALGSLEAKRSLAATDAFKALVPPPGDPLVLGYLDGAALRNALPVGASAFAARLALADLDGAGMVLSHEADAIHLSYEVVLREGSRPLEVVGETPRDAQALARLAAPVLAAYDLRVNGEALDRALGGAITAMGESLSVFENDVSKSTGIDLRKDVTQNLSGSAGVALLALPSKKDAPEEFQVAAWVGVKDPEAAAKALSRVHDNWISKLGADAQLRSSGDTDIVFIPAGRQPQIQLFVHGAHLWLLFGDVDASMVIDGPSKPFTKDPRHPSIAQAVRKGDVTAGFVDLQALLDALQPLAGTRQREEFETAKPLLDIVESATFRGERDGRTLVHRSTLHTTEGAGLRDVLQALSTMLGESMSTQLARASRASRCAALSQHMLELSRKSLEDAGAPLETAWEIERSVQEECSKPTMTTARLDCYLASESIQGMAACDAAHPPREVPKRPEDPKTPVDSDDSQGEPKPVPYVDDIWPHRVDDPDSASPQPDVNYAVPLGNEPDTRGPDDALVTIVMFGDFECEHCRAVLGAVDEVLSRHGDDVRLVFRHLPLENIHPSARAAARASLAASEQDAFWAMHDALFDRGNRLSTDAIEDAARSAGLDMDRYTKALADPGIDRRIQRDLDLAAKLGVRGTPAFFVNGRYLGGRQSASAFNVLIDEELRRARTFVERRGDTRKRLYADMLEHFAPEVLQPETAIALPKGDGKRYILSTEGLPRKGASSFAQVEIIECGDFDCPFCARSRKALEETLDEYPGVALYFAHNPLDYHPGAEPAARAAQAAHAQGKFWEMHDELFKDQRSKARSDDDYRRYAARLGLDVTKFDEDFASSETAEAVATQQKLCTDNEATATPTFFINGRRVAGAQTVEQLAALVESELSDGI